MHFVRVCREGSLDSVKALLKLDGEHRVDVHVDREAAFRGACSGGHIHVVRVLLSLEGDRRINVHVDCEAAFQGACAGGHLGVVQELLALEGDRRINVNACNGCSLYMACRSGQVNVVQALLALEGDRRMDVHAAGDVAFRSALRHGEADVLQVLLALEGDRVIDLRAHNEGAFWFACCYGFMYDTVVRMLLALPCHRVPSLYAQGRWMRICMRATTAWTETAHTWRRCSSSVCLTALHPKLRKSVDTKAKAALWKHRQGLLLARHAQHRAQSPHPRTSGAMSERSGVCGASPQRAMKRARQ